MDLHRALGTLRRRWISTLGITLAVTLLAAGGTLLLTPKYTAITRLFFAVQGTDSATDLAQGSNFAEKQMTSYAQVATSPLVLDDVIDRLSLPIATDELAGSIATNVPIDTVILEVAVENPDPTQAAAIANAIGSRLATVAATLSPQRSDGSDAVKATILTPAKTPSKPTSPIVVQNVLLGFIVGLMIGAGVALVRQTLDTKIRSEVDVRAVTDSPILGTIAFDEHVPDHPVIIADEPHSSAAEAIRRLRTNLQFVGNEGTSKTLVITSSVPGEGKSTTSINLAVSMADAGARVILIDADLRRPSVAKYTGLEGRAGLTSILIGRAELDDVVQQWRNTSLHVLPAGPVPPNPSELLGSAAMSELLTELSNTYDVILLDTPPLLPVTDATILTKMVGGAVVIVGADRLHRGQLQESLSLFQTAGAHLHGLVVNKISKHEANAYGYGYGYGYGYAPDGKPVADPAAEAPVPALSGRQPT
jgi:succinoglycan biosynthesis transport protein ExoP